MGNPFQQFHRPELVRIDQAGVFEEIKAFRRQIVRTVGGLSPNAMVMLAMTDHAVMAAAEAISSFKAMLNKFLATLRTNAEGLDSSIDAKMADFAPVAAAAARRKHANNAHLRAERDAARGDGEAL